MANGRVRRHYLADHAEEAGCNAHDHEKDKFYLSLGWKEDGRVAHCFSIKALWNPGDINRHLSILFAGLGCRLLV